MLKTIVIGLIVTVVGLFALAGVNKAVEAMNQDSTLNGTAQPWLQMKTASISQSAVKSTIQDPTISTQTRRLAI